MRNLIAFCAFLCVVVTATPIFAERGIADSISYQGLLTDVAGNPVSDGPKDLIISIWTDSVGGTMLHSETVPVTTSNGLFTGCIGCGSTTFPEIFAGQTLYLQTQLAGESPIEPRTRLRSVPFAMSALSLYSEVSSASQRAKGTVKGGGAGLDATMALLFEVDNDDDSFVDYVLADSASISAASRLIGADLDDDGQPEVILLGKVAQSGARHTLGWNSIADLGQTRNESFCDADSAIHLIATDADGDGNPEYAIRGRGIIKTKPGELATWDLIYDGDDDGIPEQEISSAIVPTMSQFAVNTKGTGAQSGKVVSSSSGTTIDSALQTMAIDDDGDGLSEVSFVAKVNNQQFKATGTYSDGTSHDLIEERVGSGSAVHELSSTNGSKTGTIRTAGTPDSSEILISQSDPTGSATFRTRGDSPRKSISIHLLSHQATSSRSARLFSEADSSGMVLDRDDDSNGTPESEITSAITSTVAMHAVNTKGTGAQSGRVVSVFSSTDADSAVHELTFSSPPEGGLLLPSVTRVKEKSKKFKCVHNIRTMGGNGTNTESDLSCDTAAATFMLSGSSSLTPVTGTISISVSPDSVKDIREVTDGLEWSFHRTEHGKGGVSRHISNHGASSDNWLDEDCDGISARTIWSSSNTIGTGNSVTIQADPTGTLDPIVHSSGAHLTAGGVWTNASDENLKENFQPVDGAELLEKIEQLPISEWNYKIESDEVKHIGPTAQDFQAIFGVGSDGKSISTIDPSGIALAAIKELNTKLERENQSLRKEIDELKKIVQQISSRQ